MPSIWIHVHFKRLRFYRHETTNYVILSGTLFWRCDNCDNNVGSSHTGLETGQSQQPLFPQLVKTTMGLLWSLAHCCSGSERLVCKHCPASFRALVKLWKAWRKREMEKVRLQSESCASALQPKYFKYSKGHNSSPFPSFTSAWLVVTKYLHIKKTTGSRGNLLVTKAITFYATISPSGSQQPPETAANQSGNTCFSVATSACITSNMIDNSWATCTWCHMRNLSYAK